MVPINPTPETKPITACPRHQCHISATPAASLRHTSPLSSRRGTMEGLER